MRLRLGPLCYAGLAVLIVAPDRAHAELTAQEWRILTVARAALWRDRELTDLDIAVIIDQGAMLLRGTVPSEHHKRRAAEVVGTLGRGLEVRNLLLVEASSGWGVSGSLEPPASLSDATRHEPLGQQNHLPKPPETTKGDADGWAPTIFNPPPALRPPKPRAPASDGWVPYAPPIIVPRIPN